MVQHQIPWPIFCNLSQRELMSVLGWWQFVNTILVSNISLIKHYMRGVKLFSVSIYASCPSLSAHTFSVCYRTAQKGAHSWFTLAKETYGADVSAAFSCLHLWRTSKSFTDEGSRKLKAVKMSKPSFFGYCEPGMSMNELLATLAFSTV